jgi:DNA-binding CsgD family transcriptional regulator
MPSFNSFYGLLGRDLNQELTLQALADHRWVTITGPGGVGKTTFAKHLQRHHQTTIVYAADISTNKELELAVLQALGAFENWSDVPDVIGQTDQWLILDNLEQVKDADQVIFSVLNSLPQTRVIVTSRIVYHRALEKVIRLEPLSCEMKGDAVQLLMQVIQTRRPNWQPTELEQTLLHKLVQSLDGLPLAIEIVAARAHVIPLANLLTKTQSNVGAFTAFHALEPRHSSLEAVVLWSLELLSSQARRFLELLCQCKDGFQFETLSYLADQILLQDQALGLLSEIVDHHLIRFDGQRYWVFEVVRSTVLASLSNDVLLTLREQHAMAFKNHFGVMMHLEDPERSDRFHDLGFGDQHLRVSFIRNELNNLLAAFYCFYEANLTEMAYFVFLRLIEYLRLSEQRTLGIRLAQQVLEMKLSPNQEMKVCNGIGYFTYPKDPLLTLEYQQRSLHLAKSLPEPDMDAIAMAQLNVGSMCFYLERFEDARFYLSESESTLRIVGTHVSAFHLCFFRLETAQGNKTAAEFHYFEGIKAAKVEGSNSSLATLHLEWARYVNHDDPTAALKALLEAAKVDHEGIEDNLPGLLLEFATIGNTLGRAEFVVSAISVWNFTYPPSKISDRLKTWLVPNFQALEQQWKMQLGDLGFQALCPKPDQMTIENLLNQARAILQEYPVAKIQLSPRELEITSLLVGGLSTKVIAKRLGLSPRTVANRLTEIYAKLECQNRAEAIVLLHGKEVLTEI